METLWKLPGPSTGLTHSPKFEARPRREVALLLSYESEEDGHDVPVVLVFEGTEAFRCTYYNAMSQAALGAYDNLKDVGPSHWLSEIEANLAFHRAEHEDLRHMMITFDDGPCYEFICRRFRVEQ
jgi:hypothetical protein